MLFEGTFVTTLSGKVGGLVASHNPGGPYFRTLAIPTNPNTPAQQVIRSQFAALTVIWNDTLTQGQRDLWELYADNVTVTNRIGKQVNISGLAMFVRNNTARVLIALGFSANGPLIFNLGTFTRTTLANASATTQSVEVGFSTTIGTDPWANEAGSFLLVFLSRPQNATVNFFRGPYRFAGSIQGDPVPPASPLTVLVPFPIAAGQRLFSRTVVIYSDGRFTTSHRTDIIVIA